MQYCPRIRIFERFPGATRDLQDEFGGAMIDIVEPRSRAELDAVRDLMRAFVAWHRERHVQDLKLIDEYFDAKGFEDELRCLPGSYAPPGGRLLLANVQGRAAGCVALKPMDGHHCEMKRMFVYPRFHGQGVGVALARQIIAHARSAGYRTMRLDTSIRQAEAQRLYGGLGFRVIEPYYDLPKKLSDWLVFMELSL
jgi:putative acetyltransferase